MVITLREVRPIIGLARNGLIVGREKAEPLVNLAETRRFELLKGLTPYLVSSEAHSTGLCDVSELQVQFTGSQGGVAHPKVRAQLA
jgi:hypothetical protein